MLRRGKWLPWTPLCKKVQHMEDWKDTTIIRQIIYFAWSTLCKSVAKLSGGFQHFLEFISCGAYVPPHRTKMTGRWVWRSSFKGLLSHTWLVSDKAHASLYTIVKLKYILIFSSLDKNSAVSCNISIHNHRCSNNAYRRFICNFHCSLAGCQVENDVLCTSSGN